MTTALVPPSSRPVETTAAQQLYVVFRVDATDYALPAQDVLQMESYSGATAVPGARAFVVGIIQVRGRVVPVIDLRLRFGLPANPPSLDSRVVVGEKNGRAVALLADIAREVVSVLPEQLTTPPRLADDGGFVSSVVQVGERTILVLDFDKVVGDESLVLKKESSDARER